MIRALFMFVMQAPFARPAPAGGSLVAFHDPRPAINLAATQEHCSTLTVNNGLFPSLSLCENTLHISNLHLYNY